MDVIQEHSTSEGWYVPRLIKTTSAANLAPQSALAVRDPMLVHFIGLLLAFKGAAAESVLRLSGSVMKYLRGTEPRAEWGFSFDPQGFGSPIQPMVFLSFRSPLSAIVVKSFKKKYN